MAKVAIITTEGDISIKENDNEFVDYETLSSGVGGMIEAVSMKKFDLWCNENGMAEGLEINPIATRLYADAFGFTNYILGNVVITGGVDDEGETLGLTDEQVEIVLGLSVNA